MGWALWRDPEALPEDLVFRVNYLGGDMPTFALNFSRPGAQIVAQYYNFLRLGFEGYRRVQQECRDVATYVSEPSQSSVLRAHYRRHGASRLRLQASGRSGQLLGLRRLSGMRERLAGARVHVPREQGRPGGAEGGGQERLQQIPPTCSWTT